MDKQRRLSNSIIKTLYEIGEGFEEYWDSMDDIDHEEILETLGDIIYDWQIKNANDTSV